MFPISSGILESERYLVWPVGAGREKYGNNEVCEYIMFRKAFQKAQYVHPPTVLKVGVKGQT
jgi:hypothetical protein